jgi:PKD repeat protein
VTISAALPGQAANYTFSPTQPAINQDVVFTATGAGNVQGGTYAWDFGDGTAGTGVTATHKYTVAGTFATTLRVISNTGQSATASRTITVTGSLPAGSVNFTISPTSAGVNDIVNFNAAVSTGLNLTFKWDFGDGGSGSGQTTTHSYTNTGTFTVTLTGTNNLGQKIAVSKTIAISGGSTQLAAEFSSSPLDPTISLGTNTVYFDATPSTPGVSTWRWDFGDGANGAGQKLTHTYVQAGTWVVRLVVTDASGRTATVTHSVIVKP